MTNTIYFYNTIREYYDSSSSSASSSFREQTPQHDGAAEEVKVEAASSPIQLEQQQDDDNSTTATEKFLQTIAGMNPQQPVRTDDKDLSQKLSSKCVSPTPQCSAFKRFDFAELKTATRNFRPSAALVGTLGSVYKGWVDEHTLTATKLGIGIAISVKFLKQEEFQDSTKWLAEVNYLGKLYHPNLVRLVGYCLEDKHRLLVYEFMSRGSLENHLFMGGSFEPLSFLFEPLSWSVRMKVALGAAKGLAFLHSAESKVIYRVFNTSNILLDSNYNAKLSDLWFSKDGPTGDKSHISTRLMGTYGYAAPEYLATGHLTAKSEVYSFGVVLLEMISGQRAVDEKTLTGEHNLVEWAKPYLNHKRKIYRVLDSRLEGQCSLEGAQKAANLALQCLSMEGKFRPNMDDVVKALEELQDSKDILPQ